MSRHICIRCLLTGLLFVIGTIHAGAIGTTPPSWKPRESVTPFAMGLSDMLGADRSLAYDHHGNPGIVYSNGFINYARRVPGIGWASFAVTSTFANYPSLAYDRYERPAISYTDLDLGPGPADTWFDLGYARFDGSAWIVEEVDTYSPVGAAVGGYTSLAFDRLGRPAIAYYDYGASALKFIQDNDGDFSLMDETPVFVVNAFTEGQFSSLTFDSLNRAMIAHFDDANDDLRFSVQEPGIGWVTATVDSTGNTGRYPSLAIDPDTGFPAIAYYSTTELRYAEWDGDSWNSISLDTTGNVTGPPPFQSSLSLAFDPADGNPAIAYWNRTGGEDLKLAWHDGSIWQTQTVDAVGDVGHNPSLAFNDFGNGFPSITYLDLDPDTFDSRLFFIEDPPAPAVPEPASAMLLMAGMLSWFVSIAVRRPDHLDRDRHEL
jgi:hypothetical protein